MRKYFTIKTRVVSLLLLILILNGCEVEKFPGGTGTPEGSLYVTAVDEADQSIEQASIIINGIERPETTPAYVHRVEAGSQDVVVRKFGYWSNQSQVTIEGGDTTSHQVEMMAVSADQTGVLNVNSDPAGARILINGKTHCDNNQPVVTPALISIPWGKYDLSVNRTGFATDSPLLPEITVNAGDSLTLNFSLTALTTGLVEGTLPPMFTLENIDGDSVNLGSLTGNVVLINFWYTECVPCIAEFPGLEAVYEEFADQDFRVLSINPMNRDDREDLIRFREDLGLTFQMLLDWGQELTRNHYFVRAFPMNVLVDRTGRISAVLGSVEAAELRDLVSNLVAVGTVEPD